MNQTLKNSFDLKNTYMVNSILYSLKQVPLLKRILPDTLYQVRELKVFANVIFVFLELIKIFLGKFLYIFIMVAGASGLLYDDMPSGQVFLHILLCLTVIGAFVNTFMFNPTKDKYYAMILLGMDAKGYTLWNYGYAILGVIIGFLPFVIVTGLSQGIPLWICILIPFFVAGLKITASALTLLKYERTGKATSENVLGKFLWGLIFVLLAAAYGLPAIGIAIPQGVFVVCMAVGIIGGIFSVIKILHFQYYRPMYKEILNQSMNQMNEIKENTARYSQKVICADTDIISKRKGFEFLNELFIKRHKKVLWRSSLRTAAVCLCLFGGALLLFYVKPGSKVRANELLMTFLPYFVFIMYCINRGSGFTNVLFMNCDHSFLTYSFYKQPKFVLRLFQIRLREIIKVNLLPAAVIGGGLAALLYLSGGTDNPANYAVLFVSVICMSIFFSVHYLTIYYLLQPYNAGTEIKSATYRVVHIATYLICFFFMELKMPTLIFGLMTIVFCILYSLVACILIYLYAPKTFRLRN